MTATPEVFRQRRQRLLERMQRGVAIIPTAPERVRNRDTLHPYRYDSYFWYLTGFPEPESVLVLVAGDAGTKAILFCRDKNEEREIWDGFRYGPAAAGDTFAVGEAYPIGEFDTRLAELVAGQPTIFFAFGAEAHWDARIAAAINSVRNQVRAGKRAPGEIRDIRTLLDPMRLLKDADELAHMRRAADIASQAHRRAMAFCRPGQREYEVEAEFLHEFRRQGADAPSYPPIVAGGRNACVLHYVSNRDTLVAGDLLLIDAGCEIEGYASDITRTIPVGGTFSPAQRDAYELVLAAQAAALAAIRPGVAFNAPHDAAVRVLAQGMLDLKLLAGGLDEAIEKESYKRFYMHRTSHWLGLDVHDAGDYRDGDDWVALAPGMTLTVEPGIYIRPADDVPPALWNIGIRIEDDVVVGTDGGELLTTAPRSVAEIESAMRVPAPRGAPGKP